MPFQCRVTPGEVARQQPCICGPTPIATRLRSRSNFGPQAVRLALFADIVKERGGPEEITALTAIGNLLAHVVAWLEPWVTNAAEKLRSVIGPPAPKLP